MPNNNPGGNSGWTGRGGRGFGAGFGITIESKGMERLASKFGQELRGAHHAIWAAHQNLAMDVQLEALKVLRQEVSAHGRPQREQRGELRYLEKVLGEEDLAVIRYSGFTVPDPQRMDQSKAGRYWRQVEVGRQRTITVQGLFVLPPIMGGRFSSSQFQRPEEGVNSAVKLLQFHGRTARSITIGLGPKGGYHYLRKGGEAARVKWKSGRAEAMYRHEFKAQGMDLTLKLLARKKRDDAKGVEFIQPQFVKP